MTDWYQISHEGFDLNSAGIYEWRILGVGVYVGKAKKLRQRIKNYPNNVRRMIEGLHWHGNPKKDYRPIHYALRDAFEEGIPVSVTVLEICEPDSRAERERHWIQRRRMEALAGGLPLLNS